MKKIFFMALAAIALGACNSEPKFKVEGEVSGADGKMLYLEASALEGIVPLDSVKLAQKNINERPAFQQLLESIDRENWKGFFWQ